MLHLSLIFIVAGVVVVPTLSIPVRSDVPVEKACENACKHEHARGTSILVLDDGEVPGDHPNYAPAQSTGKEQLVTRGSQPVSTAPAIAQSLVPAKSANVVTAARSSTAEESVTAGESANAKELEIAEKSVESIDKPKSMKDSTGVSTILKGDTVKYQLAPHTDTANVNRYSNPSINYFKRVLHCWLLLATLSHASSYLFPESREYFLDPSKKVFLNASLPFWISWFGGLLYVVISVAKYNKHPM